MNAPPFARLPATFDAAPLLAEALAIGRDDWTVHFNTGYHDGGWHGTALRSPGGDARKLYSDSRSAEPLRDTDLMSRCPQIAAALARIECPLRAVRLLRLAPGAVIREHRDDDLVFAQGEARLHIPLATNPDVEFYVDDKRVIMEPGECWYLNLSLPHRVQNRGAIDRIHLVIDCKVNDWLAEQIEASTPVERQGHAPTGQQGFAEFRERVFSDPALRDQLRAVHDVAAFPARTVELGASLGFVFGEEDVRAAMMRGRQAWTMQWVI
jgi:mannose-6-phosphate isomerase-like protein (cupin superfamily)